MVIGLLGSGEPSMIQKGGTVWLQPHGCCGIAVILDKFIILYKLSRTQPNTSVHNGIFYSTKNIWTKPRFFELNYTYKHITSK